MFKRIDHVAFKVKNRAKSIAFYEDNFGFTKYYEHDVPGMDEIKKVIYLKLGDTVLEFEEWDTDFSNEGYHFCLESDSFDEDIKRLLANNVEMIAPPHTPEVREKREEGWQRVLIRGLDNETIEIRG
ncbi:MAG: VOC family protein [Erysipelotrichales bacterium]